MTPVSSQPRSTLLTFSSEMMQWIKIVRTGPIPMDIYLPRTDAQRMVYALLSMPWHPENYLIGSSGFGAAEELLVAVSWRLVPIMSRIRENSNFLSLGEQERNRLNEALEPAFRRLDKDPSASRAMSTTLCKLDNVLAQLGSQEKVVDHIIGILTVTNVEFQELVYQSMRHLRESTTATVELDMRAGTIKVPSAFGVMQQFIVDLDRIFPEDMRSHETISVRQTTVVLAAMKSCLRSEMLKSCHDTTPLLKLVQEVQEQGDVVYLS